MGRRGEKARYGRVSRVRKLGGKKTRGRKKKIEKMHSHSHTFTQRERKGEGERGRETYKKEGNKR